MVLNEKSNKSRLGFIPIWMCLESKIINLIDKKNNIDLINEQQQSVEEKVEKSSKTTLRKRKD